MKTLISLLWLFGIIVCVSAADAVATSTEPQDVSWKAIIPIIVPMLIALLKTVIPKIPSKFLPLLAIGLGALSDLAMASVGLITSNLVLSSALGAAGVGLREVVDQLRKPTVTPPGNS